MLSTEEFLLLLEKLNDGLYKFKSYWKKPPKGYEVSYKEIMNLAIGNGGLSFISFLVSWTSIGTTTYMMISYFKLSTGLVFFMSTFLGSIIALIRSPILSMIIDNSNDKKKRGKFKPFLIWTSVGTCICFGLIPYIPDAWNRVQLFTVTIPKIPIMGIHESSTAVFTLAVFVLFIISQVGLFFHTLLTQAMAGIEQTISSVAQERANIVSIKSLFGNMPGSLLNILLPVFAGILFANSGHQLNINLYRIFFPIAMVGGVVCSLFVVYGTKERVVVNQKYVAKVKFFDGAKELSKNKYFWIITIFNVFMGVRGFGNITNWVCQFSFSTSNGKTIANLFCTTILMNVLVLGMVLAPMLIRKFGKRNVVLYSNVGFAVMIIMQFFVYTNPYLVFFSAFLQNIFAGFAFISGIMVSDVLDYQQWKTGKRLEGFWQNYSAVIVTILGIFTGMMVPFFLSLGGIGFGDDINQALLDPALRDNAYKFQTLVGVIGSIAVTLPMFFYDLTEAKHANYVRALKIRAAVDNYNENVLQNIDVLNIKEIMDYANEKNDLFVLDELNKHHCLDSILENYERVSAEELAKERAEAIETFEGEIVLEEKHMLARLEKMEAKAIKKKLEFNSEEEMKNLKLKSRNFKHFVYGSLAKYDSAESIVADIENVYDEVERLRNQKQETANAK